MKKQVFNPYLPLNVYIPDGEPHVFGDRVYVYGSHDQEGGKGFCLLDYEVWSAPVNDLTDWSCPGVAYRAKQDPDWTEKRGYAMYASDCVRGNDGRFYLYYALSGGMFTGDMHVAVSDKPDGPFEYYGCVRYPDGSPMSTFLTFDPGLINDDGVIRLYYGWSLDRIPEDTQELRRIQMAKFEKSEEELDNTPQGIMGGNVVQLEDDMLTVKRRPVRVIPGPLDAAGTSFADHPFFEASSIRKLGETYYFIYSSTHQHELCYATSRYPDRDFVFGGVLVSNGDVGINGRQVQDRLMMTGNNHGSMERINGQWYIFYHRQTHQNTFSRQGCAEKLTILPDGTIPQVEMTSCGLNDGPLLCEGSYPASICCMLTNGHMPHAKGDNSGDGMPFITHEGEEHFLSRIMDGVSWGYKYYTCGGPCTLTLTLRGQAEGSIRIQAGDWSGAMHIGPHDRWTEVSIPMDAVGTFALSFTYHGTGSLEVKEFRFSR